MCGWPALDVSYPRRSLRSRNLNAKWWHSLGVVAIMFVPCRASASVKSTQTRHGKQREMMVQEKLF